MMENKEIVCPLWEICTDKWKYYSNIRCTMVELIASGEVSERAVRHIKKEISLYLDTKSSQLTPVRQTVYHPR